jgi:predicted DNA-binding transcriptional regulator AlpA
LDVHDHQLASLIKLGKLITDATGVLGECQALLAATIDVRQSEQQSDQTRSSDVVEVAPPATPFDLMSLSDAAKRLGITPNTVRAMRRAGELPEPIHISKRRRMYQRSDIEDWLRNGGVAANNV